jgi:uncharacterized RDD family membrane protein YckC
MASELPQDPQSGLPVGKEPGDGSRSEAELGPVRSEEGTPESRPLLMPYPSATSAQGVEQVEPTSSTPSGDNPVRNYGGQLSNGNVGHQSFRVATSGERLTSGLLDVIVVIILGALYTSVFGTVQPSPSSISMTLNGATVSGNNMWLFQVLALSYFFLMEHFLGGSIGKLAFGQRVVTTEYAKPTPKQLAMRSVFRLVDGFPYFMPNLLGFLILQNSDKRQRIGDRFANTMVVKAR